MGFLLGKKMTYKIANWDKWQSFRKDRGAPPWIKIHRNLLSNEDWVSLSDSEKGQLVSIWMLAADKNGEIPSSGKLIARMCMLDESPNINKFIELGFLLQDDDDLSTSGCQEVAIMTNQRRGEERREEESRAETEDPLSGKPDDTPKNTQECEAIDYLNHVAGKNFRHADTSIKLLRARLKEGATLAEVKRVIDVKAKEWLGTDSEQYLRPATLFNATKFNQYIGQCGKTSQEADMDAWLNDEEPPIFGEMDNALEGEFNEI